jgi:hypothetical protein
VSGSDFRDWSIPLETGLDHLSLHSSHARSTTEFQSKQLGKGVLESTRHNEPDQRKTILYSTEIGAYALQKSEAYAATRPCAIVRRRRRDRQLNRSSIGEKLTTGRGAVLEDVEVGEGRDGAAPSRRRRAPPSRRRRAPPSRPRRRRAPPSRPRRRRAPPWRHGDGAGSSFATRRRRGLGLLLCDTATALKNGSIWVGKKGAAAAGS